MALLGLLDREPSHGYDLKRDYDAYFGRGRPLHFGQVYATLGRLARDGKAMAGEAESGAGPDRKRYAITARRDRFGFVFQFGQLVPELTADENVALPLLLGGTYRDQALRAARSWFERADDGLTAFLIRHRYRPATCICPPQRCLRPLRTFTHSAIGNYAPSHALT